MRPADAAIPYEPAALARAFLALAETGGEPLPRRVPRVALALLSALTIALALPLLWAATTAGTMSDHATATVPHKPALVAAADDDEPPGGP
jgi:hypothetical protein